MLLLRDASTVPLVALAARRYQVPVVHLEAGPRSFNERSLEEVNRRTVAAMTSLHLAPTTMAAGFPADEGVPPSRVEVVGNYLGRRGRCESGQVSDPGVKSRNRRSAARC